MVLPQSKLYRARLQKWPLCGDCFAHIYNKIGNSKEFDWLNFIQKLKNFKIEVTIIFTTLLFVTNQYCNHLFQRVLCRLLQTAGAFNNFTFPHKKRLKTYIRFNLHWPVQYLEKSIVLIYINLVEVIIYIKLTFWCPTKQVLA